jgi:hypothetical protein
MPAEDEVSLPIDGEMNPNHPVTQEVRDMWYKIAALLMIKFKQTAVEITPEDVDKLGDNTHAVVADTRGGKFVVRLVGMEEAERLVREHGGEPA